MSATASAAPSSTRTGVVGTRQLVLIQTVDIARLTMHPVPLVPGTFIAVGGRGPKGDSNESGKTSFLAATSLLLGDTEWRTSSQGGSGAAALLFEPEVAGVPGKTYVPARHGYVIGVFAEPSAPEETALTVWMRISVSAPYLLFRWRAGLHLPESRNRREIDAMWEGLGGRDEAGSNTYVERLYGDIPRCLAYVSRRGQIQSRPSLLQMNAGAFSRRAIADDLITLTGKGTVYEQEATTREDLHRQQGDLERRRGEHVSSAEREEHELEAVRARQKARDLVESAVAQWELHFAAGLVAVTRRKRELEAKVTDESEQAKPQRELADEARREIAALADEASLAETARLAGEEYARLDADAQRWADKESRARSAADERRRSLKAAEEKAVGWSGFSVADATSAESVAATALERARVDEAAARAARELADAGLLAVEAGGSALAARSMAALSEAGVSAAGLLNSVELEDSSRAVWEPRLLLLADAVAVAATDREAALRTLAALPGSILVAGDPVALPAGVASAPAGSEALLVELGRRFRPDADDLPLVTDTAAGLHVVGGHAQPVVGYAARLAAASVVVQAALGAEGDASKALEVAKLRQQAAKADLEAALSAVVAAELRADIERLDLDVSAAASERGALAPQLQGALDRVVGARSKVESREAAAKSWEARLDSANRNIAASDRAIAELRKQVGDQRVEYWAERWGQPLAEAESELAKLLPGQSRDPDTIRIAASMDLNDAVKAYAGPGGDLADIPELREVAGRRPALSGEEPSNRAEFEEILKPLQDLLEQHMERDTIVEERIQRERTQREQEVQLATEACRQLSSALEQIQDAIEDLIRNALTEVSHEFNRLDRAASGFGASVEVECRRPVGPTDPWVWEATPRWRRSPSGSLLPYDHQTNTAQEKQHTVHLVLAALLSSPNSHGRVLVLDELGDSLGVQHRHEVLQAVSACAESRGFTVLATCQDAVLPDATRFCGEVVYFEYASKSDALNRPTRVFGYDANRKRVELTVDDVTRGRGWQ